MIHQLVTGPIKLFALIVCAAIFTESAAAIETVGNGTARSCTQFALRAALNRGDTVQFNCGSRPVVISLSRPIVISSRSVDIRGNRRVTLSGRSRNRIFEIRSGSLVLDQIGLTLGRSSESGGAIYSENSDLVLISLVISASTTQGVGGAVYAQASNLLFSNTRLIGNSSSNGGGALALEGGTLDVVGGQFTANRTLGRGAEGGAARLSNSTAYFREGAAVQRNTATANGGGIAAINGSTLDLNAIRASGNVAAGNGGAVYLASSNGDFRGSTFQGNRARNHGAAITFRATPGPIASPLLAISNGRFTHNASSALARFSERDFRPARSVLRPEVSAIETGEGTTTTISDSWFVDNQAGSISNRGSMTIGIPTDRGSVTGAWSNRERFERNQHPMVNRGTMNIFAVFFYDNDGPAVVSSGDLSFKYSVVFGNRPLATDRNPFSPNVRTAGVAAISGGTALIDGVLGVQTYGAGAHFLYASPGAQVTLLNSEGLFDPNITKATRSGGRFARPDSFVVAAGGATVDIDFSAFRYVRRTGNLVGVQTLPGAAGSLRRTVFDLVQRPCLGVWEGTENSNFSVGGNGSCPGINQVDSLGIVADEGGIRALESESPLRDASLTGPCPRDRVGSFRPQGQGCDAGPIEGQ